jgi:iron complex outermembrane receptor protein
MSRRDQLLRRLCLSTAAFALTLPAASWAQTAPAKQAAEPEVDAANGEILVTGDRNNGYGTDVVQSGSFRNAKVLDVPLTISVIPSAVLKSQQAIDLIDAVRNTAGVSNTGTGTVAYNNLTIRGIAVDTRANFRLDGALNMLSATAFPLEDKDRIEVLKGASALYYGFSSPAGIVNLTMKRATPELYIAENNFFDSNGGMGAHVDVGDTVGPFGYRLNGVAAYLDTGVDMSKGHRYAAAGTFDLKPTDKLTITADVEYFEKSIDEPPLFLLTIPTGATSVKIPDVKLLDPKVNIGGADWDANKTHELNLLTKAVYKFSSDWNVSAYWGRSRLSRKRNNPQFTPTNLTTAIDPASPGYGAGRVQFSAQQAEFENVNYAAELAGTQHFGNIRNEVLIGASRTIRTLASSPNVRTQFTQNFAAPRYIADPHLVYSALPASSKVDDKGVYIFDRLSFNDVIQLLGGIRKSDYKNDGSINVATKTPYTAKPTSYSAGAVIKPMKWASLYGTYIEGLEETPAAPSTTDNATEVFAPTTSKQYEGGLKLQPKSDLLFQLAYFKIERGAAYAANLPGTTTLHYYTNGKQVYEGAELSVTGYVVPDLAIYATATVLSAHYRDNGAIAGKRVDGTPKNTWSLAGEYQPSWLDPSLKLTAGVYHTGSQAINADNVAFTPGYTTFDIGASYTLEMGGHEVVARVNGQNITNERYWASVGGNALAESLPATVKFSLGFKY